MLSSPTFRHLLSLSCALALAGCGGDDHYAPLGDVEPLRPAGSEDGAPRGVAPRDRAPLGEGSLEVKAKSAITSYLSRIHGVVTNAAGEVVAGAEIDAEPAEHAANADAAPDLRLTVPEGEDYTLTLTASTTDAEPTTCRAVIGPLSIAADSVATVRVLGWDCGGETGYVPSAFESECFWLAEWLFVANKSARVGEDIHVSAAGHDARGKLARFDWSAPAPSLGRFAQPQAARTSFRCQEPGQDQPLTVAISDAECQAQFSHRVSCL